MKQKGNKRSIKETVQEITSKIEEQMLDLLESDHWKKYLEFLGNFRQYSSSNCLLIMSQMAGATKVAGFKTWEKMGRKIKAGEKSIKILAPSPYKIKKEKVTVDELGNEKKEEEEIQISAYRAVSVFDISQTEGEDVPELMGSLRQKLPEFKEMLGAVQSITDCKIEFAPLGDDLGGFFSPKEKKIVVNSEKGEERQILTLIHELTHSILHNNERKEREVEEIEAESTAYAVCSYFGLKVEEKSIPYLTTWSSKNMKELSDDEKNRLRSVLETVQKTACQIIDGIEKHLK